MIRKSILALAAIATARRCRARPDLRFGVGLQASTITAGATASASAASTARATSSYAPDCYMVKRINRFGEVRLVRVCD